MKRHPNNTPEKCRKCGGNMRLGIAMGQTHTGRWGYGETVRRGETVWPGGQGYLLSVLKCSLCGYSHT